jgi:hypothetical protein
MSKEAIMHTSAKTEKLHGSEKRFGVGAVEQGLITREQLYEALKTQVAHDLEEGFHRPLGEILHQQGAMTWAQVDQVLETLGVLERYFGPQN